MLPNGYIVPITCIGSVKLTTHLTLENVLYVPHFNFNLLFISTLTHSLHYSFNFFLHHYFIQEHSWDQTIGMGRCQDNLYLMELGNFSSFLLVVKAICNSVNLSRNEIWHYRLRHPYYVKLQVLYKDLHIFGDLTASHRCFICHLAKQCRLPFVLYNSLLDSPFQWIHYDIWGAFHVSTNEGYRYFFFIIVDDCTHAIEFISYGPNMMLKPFFQLFLLFYFIFLWFRLNLEFQ